MEKGKLGIAFLVLSLVTVGLSSQNAFAGAFIGGFQGDFDPSNWTFFTEGNGFVDTDSAPFSIILVGSDDSEPCNLDEGGDNFCPTDFTIPIPENGYVQFFWEYSTEDEDGPCCDLAGFLINGEFFQLTDDEGFEFQSGFAVVPVNQGDVFGFRVDSTDDCCGVGSFTTIIDFMFIAENEGAYVSGGNSFGENLDSGAIGLANFDSEEITQIGDQVVTEGGLSGLTFDSNGDLFGSSVFEGDSPSELYQIDPITGDAILIGGINTPVVIEGSPGTGSVKIRDLATQPGTDVLFGVGRVTSDLFGGFVVGGCETSFPGNSIFTIDKEDASAECIGTFEGDINQIGGIAFAPDGTLYATGNGCDADDDFCGNFLASFDADGSFAGFFLDIGTFLDGLGIRPSDGAFFGTTPGGDSVYQIDLETVEISFVAGAGDSPSDITFFPFSEPLQTIAGAGGTGYEGPTLGEFDDGRLIVSDGFCFDRFCLDVLDYFNHLPIQQVDSGTTHTISMTAYCSAGSNRCNYASVGAAPPGTDINSVDWNVMLKRTGNSNDWQVTKVDPNGMLGDVTGTVQVVDASRIQYTFNIQFITPASIGTVDGNAEPPEDNMILVTEIRDSNGGAGRNIFNEGVFVNDIYAYPQVDASYALPVKVAPLCLNEDPTDRNTCAFEQVRQWTIKQAEEKLKEIYEQNNYKTD